MQRPCVRSVGSDRRSDCSVHTQQCGKPTLSKSASDKTQRHASRRVLDFPRKVAKLHYGGQSEGVQLWLRGIGRPTNYPCLDTLEIHNVVNDFLHTGLQGVQSDPQPHDLERGHKHWLQRPSSFVGYCSAARRTGTRLVPSRTHAVLTGVDTRHDHLCATVL